jgi:hypothetical protein
MNNIADGIMRKNTTTAKLTSYEKERNKKIFTPLNAFVFYLSGVKSSLYSLPRYKIKNNFTIYNNSL